MLIDITPSNELLGYNLPSVFVQEVYNISKRLGCNPSDLLDVMNFETGGTFSPSIQNPSTKATGLIQFMPSTAKSLGTSISALKNMSRLEQLKYVEKYLYPYRGKIGNLLNLCMAVFYPDAIGKPDYKFPQKVVKQNPGIYTPRDYVNKVLQKAGRSNTSIKNNNTNKQKEIIPPQFQIKDIALPAIAVGLILMIPLVISK